MKIARGLLTLLGMSSIGGAAYAQGEYSWDGLYAGFNAGRVSNNTCNDWSLNGGTLDPAIAAAFSNRNCPTNSTFIGGVQIGDNFQYKRFVWGLGGEIGDWSAKSHNPRLKYEGTESPPGTYAFSGKISPGAFGILGPRIGYAGDHWMPYLRAGTLISGGSHNSTLSYC